MNSRIGSSNFESLSARPERKLSDSKRKRPAFAPMAETKQNRPNRTLIQRLAPGYIFHTRNSVIFFSSMTSGRAGAAAFRFGKFHWKRKTHQRNPIFQK